MTLRKPPEEPNATARLVGRLFGLIILISAFALVVWVAATNQQASALERTDPLIRPPGQLVGVPGAAVHVRSFGSGEDVVVLVHDDHLIASGLLTGLAEDLADSNRMVIVPDLVGFGLSSRLVEPGRWYSVAGQADSLASVLDEAEVTEATVVGFGWGGGVAAELAVIRPDLVSSLVLAGVSDLPTPAPRWDFLESLPLGLGKAVAFTVEGASDRAERAFGRHCQDDPRCNGPEVVEYFRMAVSLRDTAASVRARRASAPASVAPSRLEQLEVPVLIVSTDSEAATALAERFPSARVEKTPPFELTAEDLAGP